MGLKHKLVGWFGWLSARLRRQANSCGHGISSPLDQIRGWAGGHPFSALLRTVVATGAFALAAPAPVHGAQEADAPASFSDLGIPMSKVPPTPEAMSATIPEPKRFVSKHQMVIGRKAISYTAVAGETYVSGPAGNPIGSIFSFSYIKDEPRGSQRPVLFVFNGGPGSSSVWLHMGSVGPRRLVLDKEVNSSNVPPFGLVDNPHSVLDVADLVFIDPVGTGWSRPVGSGKTADFWGVNEDVDTISQFIELWLTEHDRWNSPKYVMGESYGSTRAALLPRALMGGPLYVGVMRGITLNGIILLGTTLEARTLQGMPQTELREALELPALADAAWYHRPMGRKGRSLEQLHQEAFAFAIGEYAEAIALEKQGKLPPLRREAVVVRISELTGMSTSSFDKSLTVSSRVFARTLLEAEKLEIGAYDSRYTLPLAGTGNDPVADDPAMGRYVPGFISAFHQMAKRDLQISMDRPYGAIVWKDLLPTWNWKRAPIPQDQNFATDLVVAMRRNPDLQVLVASGYYDLATNSATAEYLLRKAAPPADRVAYKRYESGHMLYLGDTAGAFADDIRSLVRRTSR